MTHYIARRYRADFHEYRLRRGDVLIVQPQQLHRFAHIAGWDGWLLTFNTAFLMPNQYIEIQKKFYIQYQGLPTHIHVREDELAQLEIVLAQIYQHRHLHDDELRRNLLRLHLYVFSTLLAAFLPHETGRAHVTAQRVSRFRQLLETHFAAQKSVAFFAAQLGCTEKTLGADCQALLGKSAKALIADRILLEAQRLLLYSSWQINQIGYQVGFSEPTNFVKFFKKHTGITPLEFRQREKRAAG